MMEFKRLASLLWMLVAMGGPPWTTSTTGEPRSFVLAENNATTAVAATPRRGAGRRRPPPSANLRSPPTADATVAPSDAPSFEPTYGWDDDEHDEHASWMWYYPNQNQDASDDDVVDEGDVEYYLDSVRPEKKIYFSPIEEDAVLGRYLAVFEYASSDEDVQRAFDEAFGGLSESIVQSRRFTNVLNGLSFVIEDDGETYGLDEAPEEGTYGIDGIGVVAIRRRYQGSLLERLLVGDIVLYIEEIQLARETAVQVNPPSWGLDRIDQVRGLNNRYEYDYTGNGVDVFVVDSGISDNVDFGNRVVECHLAFDSPFGCNDNNGHGTHVAGTVAGSSYGVAKNANLVSVKVYDENPFPIDSIVAGLDWIVGGSGRQLTRTTKVINISLGSGRSNAFNSAVDRTVRFGFFPVVSAGNNNDDACQYSPASSAWAFAVGATARNDRRRIDSNYGSCVDVYAPGEDIVSAGIDSRTARNTKSGTSMSSPHVAGLAALYIEREPAIGYAELGARIQNDATPGVVADLRGDASNNNNLLAYTGNLMQSPPQNPAGPVLNPGLPTFPRRRRRRPACVVNFGPFRFPPNCV